MTVRTGVIGVGALGFHHARLLRDVEGAEFVGILRRERRAARARRRASWACRAFPSIDALLDSVDAATIVVPTPAHFAVASTVLERGIHALIEKPIAATIEQADGLCAIARAGRCDHPDGSHRALQPGDPGRAAVRRRSAVHREQPARAVQSARVGRGGRARSHDP